MARTPGIGEAELRLLKVVTERHPVKLREVIDVVTREMGVARTTVLTMLERLRHKGYLSRKKVDGVFRYEPRVSQAETLRGLVGEFVGRVLGGSLTPFTAYLSNTSGFSREELAELERVVRDLKAKDPGGRS